MWGLFRALRTNSVRFSPRCRGELADAYGPPPRGYLCPDLPWALRVRLVSERYRRFMDSSGVAAVTELVIGISDCEHLTMAT